MLVEQRHIEVITSRLAEMRTRDEFLALLNYAKPLVYGEKAIPFTIQQITYHAFYRKSSNQYMRFSIRKKNGGERVIHAPASGLKAIQRVLAFVLQCIFTPKEVVTGFVWGHSIVDNARKHTAANYVFNLDLKDFFPSVDQARVWKCLQLPPFNLKNIDGSFSQEHLKTGIRKFVTEAKEEVFYKIEGEQLLLITDRAGNLEKYTARITAHLSKPSITAPFRELLAFQKMKNEILFEDVKKYVLTPENEKKLMRNVSREAIAGLIASICCTEMEVDRMNEQGGWQKVKKNVLPQGAPTSPVLTNIVCQRLDFLLAAVAKRFGLSYTRYADDITFSSMHNVYQPDSEFQRELRRIIKEQGFHIKESKTRLQKQGYRQEVTGLVVNERVNVQKRYVKQLRMWLYYWERYGYDRANAFFQDQYRRDRGHVKKGNPDMEAVIRGKLDYLKMVRGGSAVVKQLTTRYNTLNTLSEVGVSKPSIRKRHIQEVLNSLFRDGLSQALEIYELPR